MKMMQQIKKSRIPRMMMRLFSIASQGVFSPWERKPFLQQRMILYPDTKAPEIDPW